MDEEQEQKQAAASAVDDFDKNKVLSIPAPVGSWNTRDSILNMPIDDAFVFDNFLSDKSKISIRDGYSLEAFPTGVFSKITDLMFFNLATQKDLLVGGFLADGSFDIKLANFSTHRFIDIDRIKTASITSPNWDCVQFNGALYMVNGVDTPMRYAEGSFELLDFNPDPPGTIVDVRKFYRITIYSNRLIFLEKGSLSFWYTNVAAETGTIFFFPIDTLARRGGSLVMLNAWTRSSPDGTFSQLVVATSEGEIFLYYGELADDWKLSGIFQIPKPIDVVANSAQVAAGLIVLTARGYVNIADLIYNISEENKFSNKINEEFPRFSNLQFDHWQIFYSPSKNILMSIVPADMQAPLTLNTHQHVFNLREALWSRFTNINAEKFCEGDNEIYFFRNDVPSDSPSGKYVPRIFKLFSGRKSDIDRDGITIPIEATFQQAYTSLQSHKIKRIKALKVLAETSQEEVEAEVSIITDLYPQRDKSLIKIKKDNSRLGFKIVKNAYGVFFSIGMKVECSELALDIYAFLIFYE
jgi:hypothetical protein